MYYGKNTITCKLNKRTFIGGHFLLDGMTGDNSNQVLKYPMHWRPNSQTWGNGGDGSERCSL